MREWVGDGGVFVRVWAGRRFGCKGRRPKAEEGIGIGMHIEAEVRKGGGAGTMNARMHRPPMHRPPMHLRGGLPG